MLFRLIVADVRALLRKSFIALVAIAGVSAANLVYAYGLSTTCGVDTARLSFADNLALVFAGSTPFEFRAGVMFMPPLGWLFLVLLILYATLDYPTESLQGTGLQVLIRCRSRRTWLISRYIAVFIVTAVAFSITAVVSAGWTFLRHDPFEMFIHGETLQLASLGPDFLKTSQVNGFLFFAGIFVGLEALAFIQTLFGFLTGPSASFAITLTHLVISAYARHWALLGNALMLLRWGGLVKGGVDVGPSVLFSILLALVSVVLGELWFCRADVIRKESSL